MADTKEYSTRIVRVEDLSSDTYKLLLKPEGETRLEYHAGQYAFLSGGEFNRPFSIASTPHDEYLEFHIKNNGHGLSQYILDHKDKEHALRVTAPIGESYLKPHSRPILGLAGGIGITQIYAIANASRIEQPETPFHLYWGAKGIEGLYLQEYFTSTQHPNFNYQTILSEEKHPEHRQGLIADALKEDFKDLSSFAIYLSGAPAFVEATLPHLYDLGAEKDYILSDYFAIIQSS